MANGADEALSAMVRGSSRLNRSSGALPGWSQGPRRFERVWWHAGLLSKRFVTPRIVDDGCAAL
jgi:hypothetical protein